MKPLRFMATVALIGALAACAYPVSTVEQGGVLTALYFPNASAEARVILNGVDAGNAAAFDGRRSVLTVEPGKHRVVIMTGSTVIYDNQIYVGSGSRLAIEVR